MHGSARTAIQDLFRAAAQQAPAAAAENVLDEAWAEQGTAVTLEEESHSPLNAEQLMQLQQEVDPFANPDEDSTGISTFLAVKSFVTAVSAV
jgi:hypothetical protein